MYKYIGYTILLNVKIEKAIDGLNCNISCVTNIWFNYDFLIYTYWETFMFY